MRQIGQRNPSQPGANPSADALRRAAVHRRTGQALSALATTGVLKGIYRFATPEAMNRHSDEALTRAIAANVRQRAGQSAILMADRAQQTARPASVDDLKLLLRALDD